MKEALETTYPQGLAIGYARVSTALQEAEGYSLEAQEKAIEEYCANNGYELEQIFTEQESGRKSDREIVNKVINLTHSKKATLVIARLDRFTRDLHFLTTVQKRKGFKFVAVDNPSADNLVIQIMVSIAENESNIISKRTKSALAVAKAKGVELGNHQSIIANYHRLEQSDNELWDLFVESRLAWHKKTINHKNYKQFREWIDHTFDVVETKWGWEEYIHKQKLWGVGTDYELEGDFYDDLGEKLKWREIFGERYIGGTFNRNCYYQFLEDMFNIIKRESYSEAFQLPILEKRKSAKAQKKIDSFREEHEYAPTIQYIPRFIKPNEELVEGFKLPIASEDIYQLWRSIARYNTLSATETRVETARKNAVEMYQPIIEEGREQGFKGIRALGRYLTRERIETPKGNTTWSPSSVQSVLKLIDDSETNKPLTDKYKDDSSEGITYYGQSMAKEDTLSVWDALRLGKANKVVRRNSRSNWGYNNYLMPKGKEYRYS